MAILINDIAKIYTTSDIYLMPARFVSKDKESIHLATNLNTILKEGMMIKVVLTSEAMGLLPFRCRIVEISQRFAVQQHIGLELKIEELLPAVQRRKDIKVGLDCMKVEIELINIATDEPYGDSDRKTCKGRIDDISASGLLFVSNEKLMINQQFLAPLPEIDPQMVLRAKIVRTQRKEKELTGYGCKFVDLDAKNEEILRQYVFKMQVRRHRIQDD